MIHLYPTIDFLEWRNKGLNSIALNRTYFFNHCLPPSLMANSFTYCPRNRYKCQERQTSNMQIWQAMRAQSNITRRKVMSELGIFSDCNRKVKNRRSGQCWWRIVHRCCICNQCKWRHRCWRWSQLAMIDLQCTYRSRVVLNLGYCWWCVLLKTRWRVKVIKIVLSVEGPKKKSIN
jgi:hypothetical protein